jgi:formylmethanofuran dehydrogenase subunit E
MGNAPMKKSPFKSEHKSRKVTCEKCGETFDRFYYERIHKGICTGGSKVLTLRPGSK